MFRSTSDAPGCAQVTRSRGIVLRRQGRLDEAGQTLDLALEALRAVRDRRSQGLTHISKALVALGGLRWQQAAEDIAAAEGSLDEADDGPWTCRLRALRLRVLTQDERLRPYTAQERSAVLEEVERFVALAGPGFVPTWTRPLRRRVIDAEPRS